MHVCIHNFERHPALSHVADACRLAWGDHPEGFSSCYHSIPAYLVTCHYKMMLYALCTVYMSWRVLHGDRSCDMLFLWHHTRRLKAAKCALLTSLSLIETQSLLYDVATRACLMAPASLGKHAC